MDTRIRRVGLKNPQESANLLSLLCFGWTVPVLWKGARQVLAIEDLYDPLNCEESESLGDRLEREWRKELKRAEQKLTPGQDEKKTKTRRPSLTWAIVRMFWVPYMLQGLLLLVQATVVRIMPPILQKWIISYFNPGQKLIKRNQALLYTSLLAITTLCLVFMIRHTTFNCQRIGMRVRVACCSLVYRKVLRLNQAAMNNAAAGQVANLMSNDVARFDALFIFLHYLWVMPIQVSLMGYVMWRSVGAAALVGIGVLLIQSVIIQGYMSRLGTILRSRIAKETDRRVQLMSELISGIQVIKLYSWEKPFEVIVSKARALETKLIEYTSYLRAVHRSMLGVSDRFALYLTLITFIFMGNPLTPETTFLLVSLLNSLQFACSLNFTEAMIMAGEATKSVERLRNFLLLEEVKCEKSVEMPEYRLKFDYGVAIEMKEVAANWVHGQLPPTLCGVSMEVMSRSLCIIVGPVASGKSSLLHTLLGELPVGSGRVSLLAGENNQTKITHRDIRISYSSQDPWLFSASVRDNILFGQPYEETRYKEVIRVCALLKDFEELPYGDLSFVGERGASLSGGQRARVNLARAVYRDAELYLLDDPLSAVDARVGRHLFEECITGFLKDKTRILVTHQQQYLQQADTIVVLKNGTVKRQGTYQDFAQSHSHHLDLKTTEETDGVQQKEEDHITNIKSKTISKTSDDKMDAKSTDSSAKSKEHVTDVAAETIATGKMSREVYWAYFSAGGNLCVLSLLTITFVLGQVAASGTDYWVTYWTNQESERVALQLNKSSHSNHTETDHQGSDEQWLDEFGLVPQHLAVYVYTFCILGCIFLFTLRNTLFMRICMNASRKLHGFMFANLLQTTMLFFNANPSGRILNRFSKDMGALDELLPLAMLDMLQIFSLTAGILAMVIVMDIWMIIPAFFLCFVIYIVKTYYVRIVHNIKRLEGIAKSPVFSHVSATLDGLATIRSRGAEAEALLWKEFDRHQDTHTGAWYLMLATFTAFGFFLDLVSCVFITCVCSSFILADNERILGGTVGLAISQSLALIGMLQFGVKQSAEVISQMTSVERMLQYTKLPKEGPFTTERPPPLTWPTKGALTFRNVNMRYADNKPKVLKNLNLSVKPGWKVGIVGRTGAGKSSLISALFRLTGDGLEGEILLDGIDTKSIGLHELRPRISIIPQEPFLFSASLRYNLDPFGKYSDAELWDSLREVELGDAVSSLDSKVTGGGANFSVGQRQLICLARAILRNNRILVLDEATANIDQWTEALIQNTVRRRFADCTVLTIAHRLNTIMDSDRVLVMGAGSALEFDHPHSLLKNSEGHFSQMLQQTGNHMAAKLAGIAESAFSISSELPEKLNRDAKTDTENGNTITHL